MARSQKTSRRPSTRARRASADGPPPVSPLHIALVALAVTLVTVAVYAQVRRFQFVTYDDPDYVTSNPRVLKGLTLDNVRWAFTSPHAANWHPLTWLSHMADVSLFGPDAAGHHHLTSLALHIANSVLLLVFLALATRRLWPSALVAALFALHPLHVQSVAWVAERKDVLSTFFLMLMLLAWLAWTRRPSILRYALAALALALGLMAKPMLVSVPFLLLLLDAWPLRRFALAKDTPGGLPLRRLIIEKLPLFALAAASATTTFFVQHAGGAMFLQAPLGVRLANAVLAYGKYLWKTVVPTGLAFYYPFPHNLFASRDVLWAAVALLALVMISVFVVRRVRTQPWLIVGWLWFLGSLVPVIGLVQVGDQAMSDRYTYIPLIGLFVMIAFALADIVASRPSLRAPAVVAAILAVVACALVTCRQAATWRNDLALYTHAIRVNSRNHVAWHNLANNYRAEKKFTEADEAYRNALAIVPAFAQARSNYGLLLADQRRYAEALVEFREAAADQPDLAAPRFQIGRMLIELGRPDDALQLWRDETDPQFHPATAAEVTRLLAAYAMVLVQENRLDAADRVLALALEVDPRNAVLWSGKGILQSDRGDLDAAADDFRRAIELDPGFAHAHNNLGAILTDQRHYADAMRHFARALELQPDYPDAISNLASLLATAPDAAMRDGPRAVTLAQRAVALSPRPNPNYLDNLAAACAEVGQFDRAVAFEKQALALAKSRRMTDRIAYHESRLQAYTAQQRVYLPPPETPSP